MPYKDKEKRKECQKRYRQKHKEEIRQYSKKHYQDNIEEMRERSRKYREKNKEKIREKQKKYREIHREEINEKAMEKYLENRGKILEWQKKYRQEHLEKRKESNKKWYQKNREREREKARKEREEHPQKTREKDKEYYHNNKEKHKVWRNRYLQTPKGKANMLKHLSKRREKFPIDISEKDYLIILQRDKVCVYCGTDKNLEIDHINPNGSTTISNLVLSCKFCNSSKQDKNVFEWCKEKNIGVPSIVRQLTN